MQASQYSAETYFFVMKTLDKCSLMIEPIAAAEYNAIVTMLEQNELIRRYDAGELFNDEEEMQQYFLAADEEELLPTQDLEQEYPLTQENPADLPSDFDAEAFWDLTDLPEFPLE